MQFLQWLEEVEKNGDYRFVVQVLKYCIMVRNIVRWMMALKSTEEAITEGVKESYIPIILAAANNSLQHYPFVYVL